MPPLRGTETDGPPSLEDVPPIGTPTLLRCGEDDGCIDPALFDRADEVLDECRVVRVREAGSFPHQERPDVVREKMREWV